MRLTSCATSDLKNKTTKYTHLVNILQWKSLLNKCSTGEWDILPVTRLVEMERKYRRGDDGVRRAEILKSYWRLIFYSDTMTSTDTYRG